MHASTLFLALLLSTFRPVLIGDLPYMRHTVAIEGEDTVLVAVLPAYDASYDRKTEHLIGAAQEAKDRTGKTVLLTEDLLTYLSILRIERRGDDEYEREVLRSRSEQVADHLYLAG